ncbi:GatB/YqeY domain-containing protein [Conexibacter arvalis]|uniref:Glutamyl-tRNA amidotransferase n=1 Tax=Conexibacter arvalis TaxID=912552 RepID=A0A840IE78_9ACTN|nr:GatB/YqeY domain-containing protein [Conexibacter arvalis]MBB4662374.1 hypothetical protein [Conexibacter arvalis]
MSEQGTSEPTEIRARLRAALSSAMKARDRATITAIRSALTAIDDAEAVDPASAGLRAVDNEHLAGTVGGLGAGEVARAALGEEAIRAVVVREIEERRDVAADYERLGRPDEAARLRAEADALAALV